MPKCLSNCMQCFNGYNLKFIYLCKNMLCRPLQWENKGKFNVSTQILTRFASKQYIRGAFG